MMLGVNQFLALAWGSFGFFAICFSAWRHLDEKEEKRVGWLFIIGMDLGLIAGISFIVACGVAAVMQ